MTTSTIRTNTMSLAEYAPALVTRVVRNQSQIEPIWEALESTINSGHLTSSWAWTSSWLAAYGDSLDHWFVLAQDDGKSVGVALVTRGRGQKRGPLPVRALHLGTAGERPGEGVWVEYNRLLVHPSYRDAFVRQLMRSPGTGHWTADVVQFDGFAPEELNGLDRGNVWQERTCYAALLDKSRPTIDTFDGDTRRKLRNNLKRFTEHYGEIATEWVDAPSRATEVLNELIEHHQERWTSAGKPGAFASSRFRNFHERIIAALLPSHKIVLVRVTAGEQLVGIFYGFVENGVIFHYQWGLTPFEDNKLSPGFVTGYKVMEEAAERGLTELNWLAGESRYKRELSNTTRSLIWAEYPRSPWMHVVNSLISAKRILRGRS